MRNKNFAKATGLLGGLSKILRDGNRWSFKLFADDNGWSVRLQHFYRDAKNTAQTANLWRRSFKETEEKIKNDRLCRLTIIFEGVQYVAALKVMSTVL